MAWNRIRGHRAQIEMLNRAVARERLAHAFLFLGPEGIGKRLVARTFAQGLFCPNRQDGSIDPCGDCPSCKQVVAGSHPDLLEVSRPEGKRELPIELIVGARERRGRDGLCHDLMLKPMAADRRIAIIDDAHTMNEESANALLKTLEEPPIGSVMILLAPDAEMILPTIRSRCQPLWFAALPADDVISLLIAEGTGAAEAQSAAALSNGSLETARRLLDPALSQVRKVVRDGLARIGTNPQAVTAATMTAIEEGTSDSAGQRETASWAIRFAIEYFREKLREEADENALDNMAASIDRCFDAEGHLHQSMPVPLCLAGLFDDLSKIARTGLPTFS